CMTTRGRWWTATIAGLLLVATGAAVWFWQRKPPVPVVKVLLPQPCAVAPGVYLLGKTLPAAAYLVETADGLVLIDSGLEDEPTVVTDQLVELGFDPQRLRAILLTHVHADHSLGAQRLRERTGAKVHAGRGDCPPL